MKFLVKETEEGYAITSEYQQTRTKYDWVDGDYKPIKYETTELRSGDQIFSHLLKSKLKTNASIKIIQSKGLCLGTDHIKLSTSTGTNRGRGWESIPVQIDISTILCIHLVKEALGIIKDNNLYKCRINNHSIELIRATERTVEV